MDELSLCRLELERRLRHLRHPLGEPVALPAPPPTEGSDLDFRQLFYQHQSIMYLLDFDSLRVLEANQACLDFYGYSRQEFLELSITDLNAKPLEYIHQELERVEAKGQGFYQFEHRLKDGQTRQVEVRTTPVALPDGRRVYFAVVQDISQRRQREEDLRRSEERYRLLVENARELVVVIQDGVFRYVNPRSLELSGFRAEELLGRFFLDFVAPEDREAVGRRHLARVQGQRLTDISICRILHRDGGALWMEMSGAVIEWEGRPAVMVMLTDVSQRRQAEEERVHSEKLQAAIETAGAACHELNQPLQALLSQLELLVLKLPQEDPQVQALEVVLGQALKLARITQHLNRLTDYRTRQYLSQQRILDIQGSSSTPSPAPGADPDRED